MSGNMSLRIVEGGAGPKVRKPAQEACIPYLPLPFAMPGRCIKFLAFRHHRPHLQCLPGPFPKWDMIRFMIR